jgi:hypothetical protein
MAQWNKQKQDFLNQDRSLFEVFMQADRYGYVLDPLGQGFSGDLFGRLKVSEPYTLFDSTHRYSQDGDFSDVILGVGSTVGIITAQSSAILGIGATAGCSFIRESKRVFSYQPGKSLQVLQTFVFNPEKENLIQRVGYASSENGVMLELNGSQLNIIKRTAISGVGTTITVPQLEWNLDTLDGTGFSASNPSGIRLDISKAQILFTEYEWLGVGSVRVGFAIDGRFISVHQFNHANVIDSTYMTTATLPCRYEILNTGTTSSSSAMKQICISVQSNGGYEKRVTETIARRTSVSTVGTSFSPLVSIRLAPGREDSVVLPQQYSILPTSTDGDFFEIALIKNASLSGVGWTSTDSPNVQADYSASSLSGGEIVRVEYLLSASTSGGPFGGRSGGSTVSTNIEYNWDTQLGRTQAKVSDTYTLAARVFDGDGTIIGSLGFYDLT